MREETDKEGRKRGIGHHLTGWLSQENREAILVDVTLTLAFLALAVLVVILTVVLQGSDRLKLENDVERKFNELVFDIQQNRTDSQVIMGDESILGVGLYDSSGRLVRGWGQVYNMLPVASIASATGDSGSDTIMRYDSDSRTMIYIRFLREPLAVGNVGTMTMSFLSGDLVRDNSTIMYLAFDGSAYIARRNIVYLSSFLGVLGVCLLYVFVLRINIQNRQYKEEMVRQGNLVNLGQAARTLTHEIKNPLSAITIQTALLKRQLRDSEYLDEIALIESETQRLINLTNRVSDFLRNPEGKPEQIDLVALVEHLVPLFGYPIRIIPTSEKQAYILFDPDRLRSVLENILKNAIESCEGRDPLVEVEVVLGRRGMYHVYVRDRGDGIQGDAEKLFDPFYTTKIHGSGIGLAISRQFLRARGGDIRISDRPGGGTVVEIIVARYSYMQELVVSTTSATKLARRGK